MDVQRKRLYVFILIACLIGYIWLIVNLFVGYSEKGYEVCLFKHITGIPCPSCGTTSSILVLFQGELLAALSMNPLGFVVLGIMIVVPIWIFLDLITRKETFWNVYKGMEKLLRQPLVYIPAILLIVIIWILNIIKA